MTMHLFGREQLSSDERLAVEQERVENLSLGRARTPFSKPETKT
jgi:hypothetical protein